LNFGKSYTYLAAYKASGMAEKSGTIAKIAFKALKAASSTTIKFEETLSMPGSIEGTMILTGMETMFWDIKLFRPGLSVF